MDQQKQMGEGQELDLPSIQQGTLEEQQVWTEMAANIQTQGQNFGRLLAFKVAA